MARSRANASPRPAVRWLRYILMLVFGGGSGVGGLFLKDHPILQSLVSNVTERVENDEPLTKKDAILAVVKAVERVEAYRSPGDFEVTFTGLKLDPAQFKPGQSVDLRGRLIKRDAKGRESTVWDSRSTSSRPVVVGTGETTPDWAGQPINVSWKPGESFEFEVWEHKRLFDQKALVWTGPGDQSFPLRSGGYALDRVEHSLIARGKTDPSESRLNIKSRPMSHGDQPTDSVAAADDGDIRIK